MNKQKNKNSGFPCFGKLKKNIEGNAIDIKKFTST